MTKRKNFSILGFNPARYCSRYILKKRAKHEFDAKFSEYKTYRTKKTSLSFEEIITNEKNSILRLGEIIKKISDITNLPDVIISSVILDFFEIVALGLSKNKKISLQSIASFSIEDNKIVIHPSKQYKEECGLKM